MTPALYWQDWSTGAEFRIRISNRARDALMRLPATTQVRVRSMLHELAELADCVPITTEGLWRSQRLPVLQIKVGDTTVRYGISEENRTLTVEDVLVGSRDDEGFGRIA